MTPQLLTVIKEDKLKTWTKEEWAKWWVEPKYDGARLIYHKGQFLSRTGKPLHNLEHIGDELSKNIKGWTFDGEVYGDNWADTMSVARSSKTVKAGNGLSFAVFDCMHDCEWEFQSCQYNLMTRRECLPNLIGGLRTVHIVEPGYVNGYAFFRYIHMANLGHGCDGTVLKRWDSLYEFKRTKTWLKVKPVETYDGTVVGHKEGTGKYKGMLGALEILVSPGVTCFCSGMTDEQRRDWWENPDRIAGKTIEVSARGVHPSGRLIEPRFIRIREDK